MRLDEDPVQLVSPHYAEADNEFAGMGKALPGALVGIGKGLAPVTDCKVISFIITPL